MLKYASGNAGFIYSKYGKFKLSKFGEFSISNPTLAVVCFNVNEVIPLRLKFPFSAETPKEADVSICPFDKLFIIAIKLLFC